MNSLLPPPLPPGSANIKWSRRTLVYIAASILAAPIGLCVTAIAVLRIVGLIQPFAVPTNGMSPAIAAGDHIVMESLTYRWAKPARGDLIVFRTDGISAFHQNAVFVMRLVGLPGDEIILRKGQLYVNGQPTTLRNKAGEIHYTHSPYGRYLSNDVDPVFVPDHQLFVLGDNSKNNVDGRLWGFVPEGSVLGRGIACDWPPAHVGWLQ